MTTPPPLYPPGWLVGQLPVGLRGGVVEGDDLLVRVVSAFESVGATLRAGADTTEHLVDPAVAPPQLLEYLGRWLGYVDGVDAAGEAQQRRIVAALGRSLPWRGTRRGLEELLRALTDGPVEIREPGGVAPLGATAGVDPADAVVEVQVSSTEPWREDELARFVRDEVPAHLGVRLLVVPALASVVEEAG